MTRKNLLAENESVPIRRCFVDGAFVEDGSPFEIVNPVNGQVHAVAIEANQHTIDRAVKAARRAMQGEWGSMPMSERRALLYRVADEIERRFDDFLYAEIADTGKPEALARHIDIPRGAANFRVFADVIANVSTETFETDTPDGQKALNYVRRKPLGVVSVICPWNLPLLLMTWKVAPAMACGNAVIVKPSEETPSTATLLAEVMRDVGVPAGAFNLVHGFGPDSAGEFLVSHPDIDAITFTGETQTGTAIQTASAKGMKEVSFELGGKNAAIVFADADLKEAVKVLARSAFSNTGQVCLAPERIYVEREVFDQFVQDFKIQAEQLVPGGPFDSKTTLGPLISAKHQRKVLQYYDLAVQEGATVITGGGVPDLDGELGQGFYVEPTVWTGLPETARCTREEIFGPVCHIAPFDTPEQAVFLTNDTKYGLAATVWTSNLTRAHQVSAQLEVGIVWVNCWFLRDLRTPFGGMKMSGIGREGGVHSVNFYSKLTNICIKL